MNKKYIISLDLDNTLLNTKGKITNKTKKYLKELHDNGHIIVIATSRIFDTCYEVISKLDFINYIAQRNEYDRIFIKIIQMTGKNRKFPGKLD